MGWYFDCESFQQKKKHENHCPNYVSEQYFCNVQLLSFLGGKCVDCYFYEILVLSILMAFPLLFQHFM